VLLSLAVPHPATAEYDSDIPTPDSFLGYPLGEWVTDYAGMERYFSALAAASPRVVFATYGEDYEHRQLRYAVVSSAANIQRLDEIKTATRSLSDPRTLDAAEVSDLIENTPVVVWLNYSTDGNETAGLESALMMAHHFAAATDDETTSLLDEAVLVITPVMNPSSHERWATWSNSFASLGGNEDPNAMEHNPPWGVLTNNNHYLVDVNRESLWAFQRESSALRRLYYEWIPAIFVDHHGEYDNFTGPGYEEPLNPLFTDAQQRWLDRMGRDIGESFGEHGWSYFPWETGTFYPGFWESMGLLNGAIGFTYETIGGGSKGLRYRRPDGSVITLELAARQNFEASKKVIETAVAARRELLTDFAGFFRSALELADAGPERAFIVDPGNDPGRAWQLVEILMANRVEVYRTTRELELQQVHGYVDATSTSKSFAAGVYVIPVDQPQARLLLTLMRRNLDLPQVTLERAEEFRRQQETAGYYNPKIDKTTYLFYDVTAWPLPLTFNVPAYWSERAPADGLERVGELEAATAAVPDRPGSYGYLFPGHGNTAMALLVDLLAQDLVVNVAWSGFTAAGRSFPRGSLLIRNERNPGADLLSTLSAAARRHGIDLVAVDTPHSDSGPSLGSDQFVYAKRPKIAVLAGDPVSTRSFGDLWFTLERLYQLPFTAVYKEQLDAKILAEYDVLVLPHGWYTDDTFTKDRLAELKSWITQGGSLVCLKGAASWAAQPERELAAARLRATQWPLEATADTEARETVAVPGAILRAEPDPHHFLAIGYDGSTPVLVQSNLAFETDSAIAAPFRFAELNHLKLAGFAYPDSLERLAGTPYALEERVGSGHIVLILDDPNFRLYWQGLSRFFLNSLVLSPSF
ncbi:MAG: M14 family zinc carboxypeptidase, partial [Thermoanaerobaculia bacterium]